MTVGNLLCNTKLRNLESCNRYNLSCIVTCSGRISYYTLFLTNEVNKITPSYGYHLPNRLRFVKREMNVNNAHFMEVLRREIQ